MNTGSRIQYAASGLATGATNATATVTIDALNSDEAAILVGIPAASATNSSYTLSAMLVKAGDTSAVTSAETIVTGGTDFTLPVNNNTASPAYLKVVVPGPLKKRYLFVQTTPSAAFTVSVLGLLTRTDAVPSAASDGFAASHTKG